MTRLFPFLLACPALLAAQGSRWDVPAGDDALEAALPVGRWNVAFANGVVEECRVGDGGEASVQEPLRASPGRAVVKGDSVVITFDDDRVERWTPAGKRFLVEHWFPGSRFPAAIPVRGVAERAP
jgi:hypothetical protein